MPLLISLEIIDNVYLHYSLLSWCSVNQNSDVLHLMVEKNQHEKTVRIWSKTEKHLTSLLLS